MRLLSLLILVTVVLCCPPAMAAFTLASVSSTGAQANDSSDSPAISANGRYVAFHSNATTLVPNDTNMVADIYVYDRQTGETTRVSIASDGTQANGASGNPTISSDGRYVAFYSYASNLVSGDTNAHADIFVHDRQTGITTRESINNAGAQGDNDSNSPAISGDGRYIAFASYAANLDTADADTYCDVFLRDRQTGNTTLISKHADDPNIGETDCYGSTISMNGRYVAFDQTTWTEYGEGPAVLRVFDTQTGITTDIDNNGIDIYESDNVDPCFSEDGRYLAYAGNNSSHWDGFLFSSDIYIRDMQTGITTKLTGNDGTDWSCFDPSISADGRYVTYAIAQFHPELESFTGEYLRRYDRQTGATLTLTLPVATDNISVANSPCISADGSIIAFRSNELLTLNETNTYTDVYIADLTSYYQPDLQIQGPADAGFLGAHLYNDAVTQTSTASVTTSAVYHLLLGNDGITDDVITLRGSVGENGWTVKYYDERPDGGEVTAQVTALAGWTVTVTPTTPIPLRVEVTTAAMTKGNAICSATISAVSSKDATKSDFITTITRFPLQSVALVPSTSSPVAVGNLLTFTATTIGGDTPEFKFRTGTVINGITTWNAMPVSYSPNPVFTWTPPATGTYCFMVYARAQGTTLVKWSSALTYTVKPPLTALALTVTPTSPQPWDQALTLTVTPTGGAKPEYRFKACYRDTNNALQWLMLRDYAPTPTWTGKLPQDAARTYTLYAYAREQGTTVTYLLYTPAQNFITKTPLSALAMTVTPTSPQPWDTTLTVTATATGGVKLEYAFKASYIDATGATVKLVLRDYAPSPTWTGKLPQDAPRTYLLYVYAREQGTMVTYLKSVTQSFTTKAPLSALAMSITPSSPQLLSTALTVQALPTGGCKLEYAFKASYTDATGATVKLVLQDYSPYDSWTGTLPQDLPRTYLLYVYARERGTTVTYLKSVTQSFTTKAPLSALAMSVSPASPQFLSTSLTVQALPTGGCKLEYAFKASYTDATGATVKLVLQDYSPYDSWTGTLPQDLPRTYVLYVYARERGTTVIYLMAAAQNFSTKVPLSALAMSVTPVSPQLQSTTLTVQALPTGGCMLEYAFKASYTDASGATMKLVLQDYSPSDSWRGILPKDLPRTYVLYVYAREHGTTVPYLMSTTQTFTINP